MSHINQPRPVTPSRVLVSPCGKYCVLPIDHPARCYVKPELTDIRKLFKERTQ
jgi:hypothetical protein